MCVGHWWLWIYPSTHRRGSLWPQSCLGPSSSPAVKGWGLQEYLSLCAKEHILLTLHETHSYSAQKKLLEFPCDPKTSEAQRSSVSAAADPWGAAVGTHKATRMSSLQVQRDRLSTYAGFSRTSQSGSVSYFPTAAQLQQGKYWMLLTELN